MAFDDKNRQAIADLYKKFAEDVEAVLGVKCDVINVVHHHHDNEHDCPGALFFTNTDPEVSHKLVFNAMLWAEDKLMQHHAETFVPPGTTLN